MSEERIQRNLHILLGAIIALVVFIFSGSMFWAVLIAVGIVIFKDFITSEKNKGSFMKLFLYSMLAIACAYIVQLIYIT